MLYLIGPPFTTNQPFSVVTFCRDDGNYPSINKCRFLANANPTTYRNAFCAQRSPHTHQSIAKTEVRQYLVCKINIMHFAYACSEVEGQLSPCLLSSNISIYKRRLVLFINLCQHNNCIFEKFIATIYLQKSTRF